MIKEKNCFNYRYILLALCLLSMLPTMTLADSLTLSGPGSVVKEGYFTVSVRAADEAELNRLTIEVASNSEFTQSTRQFPTLGDFKDISLTGFSNGSYYLRARAQNANGQSLISNTIKVTVKHYPLWQALTLFFIGLVIFVTLVATLLLLHRQWVHSRKEHHD
ncbi:hypothetical protein [Idiomarina sp. HP20-50]|uniref:hypothetical protein n=1 Tax=Idiomarina sp. HP20-50 TaxID=3070813 RepID=UPI00294B0CF4|nr:hypothetical protein [Idiomarina sp. HP20-50]MDV6314872.1 hypothetical protein [Idiomarina sp. HP20-50]